LGETSNSAIDSRVPLKFRRSSNPPRSIATASTGTATMAEVSSLDSTAKDDQTRQNNKLAKTDNNAMARTKTVLLMSKGEEDPAYPN
jgi:hypothetical protein